MQLLYIIYHLCGDIHSLQLSNIRELFDYLINVTMHLTDYILYVLVFVVDSEQLLIKFHTKVVFEVFYKVLEVFCYDLFKF